MHRVHRLACGLATALVVLSDIAIASPTTYVATFGTDTNVCNAVSFPCRSFAGALTKTDVDGKIIVLDSGGYGQLQINKSVSIVGAEGLYAGVSVVSGDGIDVLAPATRVRLSGLTISGVGGPAGWALAVTTPATVSLERSLITGFPGATVNVCCGDLQIADTAIYGSGSSFINVTNTGQLRAEHTRFLGVSVGGQGARVAVRGSLFAFGSRISAYVAPSDVSPLNVSVDGSVFSDGGGIDVTGQPSLPANLSLFRSAFVRVATAVNVGTGIGGASAADVESCVVADSAFGIMLDTNDPGARLTLSNATIVRNSDGIGSIFNTPINTRANSTIRNNSTDVFGSPLVPMLGL